MKTKWQSYDPKKILNRKVWSGWERKDLELTLILQTLKSILSHKKLPNHQFIDAIINIALHNVFEQAVVKYILYKFTNKNPIFPIFSS